MLSSGHPSAGTLTFMRHDASPNDPLQSARPTLQTPQFLKKTTTAELSQRTAHSAPPSQCSTCVARGDRPGWRPTADFLCFGYPTRHGWRWSSSACNSRQPERSPPAHIPRSACSVHRGRGGSRPHAVHDGRDGTHPRTACSGAYPTHSCAPPAV
jgi:hypothetical protein